MARFKAWVIEKGEAGQSLSFTDFDEADLMDGDVTVRVTHSCLNYKDGLAMTGASPVVRRFPMIPGIDFSGVVEASDHPDYKPGDAVVLTGWGVGETHLGAYAEKARVKGDWLVPLPAGLSPEQAMAIGTAGYTAMLCLMALDAHGLTPKDGPALVTGASGGVGSVAVALLARAGWHVMASTGRAGEAEYLKSLGAAEIVDRDELGKPGKPLGKERWAVAVDAVGSTTLANVLAQTKADGAVAACGLAQGMDLPTSVAPFILRGVSLLGINSVTTPQAKRRAAWARLADELDLQKLAAMTNRVGLAEVGGLGADILSGKIRGRTVVEIG
ncbi:oxidoreductase [Methylobacterium sp. E-041]|jgi:acrylyl-CoA reductase (NADPH)|uniref:acrylyl-CoA reductase (NADPH) n=1 Tax=unclassified Methylobacterium TaxID=2615210 RepID=UPI001FBBE204|nr:MULTISPECIES: MDR family oxidoreductase [unclassified Methylobacterium]MCJ2007581.1 oxidoreductase [Methylobacterium sp. J-092]MCJ2077035.1 oxidoreductase [Methylobacterium sp. E-016]MCJ2107663.1 oxidoreductase [Methylobacterium sp. E-041]